MKLFKTNLSVGILIMRLSLGILMLMHGISKIDKGVGGIAKMLSEAGLPAVFAYGVYLGEVVAPVLIILGYRTRFAAIIFGVNCLVAMFLAHPNEVFSIGRHGNWGVELLGLYLFGALALFFTGGGKLAISKNSRWD